MQIEISFSKLKGCRTIFLLPFKITPIHASVRSTQWALRSWRERTWDYWRGWWSCKNRSLWGFLIVHRWNPSTTMVKKKKEKAISRTLGNLGWEVVGCNQVFNSPANGHSVLVSFHAIFSVSLPLSLLSLHSACFPLFFVKTSLTNCPRPVVKLNLS